MEHALLKMARQLDALDEASLLALWEKYANIVAQFEPTKRWEEAALVLSFIQGKRWKNQLFNHYWSAQARPATVSEPVQPVFFHEEPERSETPPPPPRKHGILKFRSRHRNDDERKAFSEHE